MSDLTPLMKQYKEIKQRHPEATLFLRGRFTELALTCPGVKNYNAELRKMDIAHFTPLEAIHRLHDLKKKAEGRPEG